MSLVRSAAGEELVVSYLEMSDETERFLIDHMINNHADVAAISDWLERFVVFASV